MRGKVKWFNAEKGYGFIQREGQPDLFVHFSGIRCQGYRSLQEGWTVDYEVFNTDRGEQATNVVHVEE